MGAGFAGRYDNAIEVVLFYRVLDGDDAVFGASVEVACREDTVRQRPGVLGNVLDIQEARDVGPAVAYEDADARLA